MTALAMTPDGRRVVSTCEDGGLSVWDPTSRAPVASFHGDAWLTACAVTSDGTTVVAGDWSGRVHLLRLEG